MILSHILQKLSYGPSLKDVRTKSRKIDALPLVQKMSALAQPSLSLSVQTHHKLKKSEIFILHQKVRTFASEETLPLSAKSPHWTNPLPP